MSTFVRSAGTRRRNRKRLFKSGDVSVNEVVATDGDRRLSHRDRVVVGGVQIWPRIDGPSSSSPNPTPGAIRGHAREHPVQVAAGPRRWLVVVEEAHNVLDRSFEVRRPADESNAGRTLLRCIDRLLQEGREMELGVMVIDQSPASLARSVISNTGTKNRHAPRGRRRDGGDRESTRAQGRRWKKLGYLQEGEAIDQGVVMDAPVKTARFRQHDVGTQ